MMNTQTKPNNARFVLCVRRHDEKQVTFLRHGFHWNRMDNTFREFFFVNPSAKEWESIVVAESMQAVNRIAQMVDNDFVLVAVRDWNDIFYRSK